LKQFYKFIFGKRKIVPYTEKQIQNIQSKPVFSYTPPSSPSFPITPIPEERTMDTESSQITTLAALSFESQRRYNQCNLTRKEIKELRRYSQSVDKTHYKFAEPESASNVFPEVTSLPGSTDYT
jgi:hypothetical protein